MVVLALIVGGVLTWVEATLILDWSYEQVVYHRPYCSVSRWRQPDPRHVESMKELLYEQLVVSSGLATLRGLTERP
jgi:hypothetical protein